MIIQKWIEWEPELLSRIRPHERMRHRERWVRKSKMSELCNWPAIHSSVSLLSFWKSSICCLQNNKQYLWTLQAWEHRYGSHSGEHLGVVLQVSVGRPGRAIRKTRDLLSAAVSFQEVMVSLLNLLGAYSPHEILFFFLKWPFSLKFKTLYLPLFPGLRWYHNRPSRFCWWNIYSLR